LERCVNTVLADKDKEVIAFTVYPKIILISFIEPQKVKFGFKNTEIYEKGKMSSFNQAVDYPGILGLINENALFVKKSIESTSEIQQGKIEQKTKNNPKKYDSESFKTMKKIKNNSNDSN